LPTKPLHLGHGHTGDSEGAEGFTHLVELERLDDGDDELHAYPLLANRRSPAWQNKQQACQFQIYMEFKGAGDSIPVVNPTSGA
jgi:hypothetical protein